MKVRELAFSAYNTRGFLTTTRELTALMEEIFTEVVDVAEQIEEDKKILEQISHEMELKENEEEDKLKSKFLKQLLSLILLKTKDITNQFDKNNHFPLLSRKLKNLIDS